jgi:hypothetical protein
MYSGSALSASLHSPTCVSKQMDGCMPSITYNFSPRSCKVRIIRRVFSFFGSKMTSLLLGWCLLLLILLLLLLLLLSVVLLFSFPKELFIFMFSIFKIVSLEVEMWFCIFTSTSNSYYYYRCHCYSTAQPHWQTPKGQRPISTRL